MAASANAATYMVTTTTRTELNPRSTTRKLVGSKHCVSPCIPVDSGLSLKKPNPPEPHSSYCRSSKYGPFNNNRLRRHLPNTKATLQLTPGDCDSNERYTAVRIQYELLRTPPTERLRTGMEDDTKPATIDTRTVTAPTSRPGGLVVKHSPSKRELTGSIPGLVAPFQNIRQKGLRTTDERQ